MAGSGCEVQCPFDDSQLRRVLLGCSCGCSVPLCRLYFCRHCLDLRCGFCVAHEVDSHYCPNCLENMPSAEARLKKNRCANCFDCPYCGHTLSTRATSTQVASVDDPDKKVPKKVYYLVCAYCRWTSREIGLPDQNVASGNWPEKEYLETHRLTELQEYYRSLAQKEKLAKENKRFIGRKLSYLSLSHKYGLMSRDRPGLPSLGASIKDGDGGEIAQINPSVARDIAEVEVLDEEELYSSNEMDFHALTMPQQRNNQYEHQPVYVRDMFPKHKHLMIKRSQRCRKCEHNLSKPEYNPSSVKFKIQLAAYYHVPEVVLFNTEPVVRGQECLFIIKVVNPTQHATKLEFLKLDEYDAMVANRKADEQNKANNTSAAQQSTGAATKKSSLNTTVGLLRNPTLVEAGQHHKIVPNAVCQVPPKGTPPVFLPPRDDAAEYDDSQPAELKGIVDDKNRVAWRKSNKVGIFMKAVVEKHVVKGKDVTVGFTLKYVYTNTISALEQREVQTVEVMVPVYINLGKEGSVQ